MYYQQQYNFHIEANATGTLTYSVEANGTSVNVDSKTGNFTWLVSSKDFKLTYVVKDAGNNSATLSPFVNLCYCLNDATCDITVANTLETTQNNLLQYGECTCKPGFIGGFCQNNISYCVNDPCFEGVECRDNFVNSTADCASCPSGYIGDGRKCFGESKKDFRLRTVTS